MAAVVATLGQSITGAPVTWLGTEQPFGTTKGDRLAEPMLAGWLRWDLPLA